MKTLLIIDGQGGGCGKALVERVVAAGLPLNIVAVGTNSLATSAMLRAGAHVGATGENAVIVNSRHADIIAGPIGIVLADALMGECSPAMATAVNQSDAPKVVIPVARCGVTIAGMPDKPMAERIQDAANAIAAFVAE